MKSVDHASSVVKLAALAQETRLALFRLLVEAGPAGLAAGVIAGRLGVAAPTLSFHLKELLHAGLVTSRQSGRFIYYAPVIAAVNGLVGYLTENCCAGSGGSCAPVAKAVRAAGKRTTVVKPRGAKTLG